MVMVPATTARLNTGPANVTLDPSIARGTAVDIGSGLFKAASTLAAFAEKQQAARNAVELMRANTAATKELNDLADQIDQGGDFKNGVAQFEQGAAEIVKRHSASISDPLGQEKFQSHVAGLAETRRVTLRNSLFKLEADDAQSALDENLTTTAQAAAQARTPLERQQYDVQAAAAIKSMQDARYIKPTQATNLLQAYRSKIDESQARSLMQLDPDAADRALNDPQQFKNLDPVKRATLSDQAQRRSEARMRQDIAAQEKAERQAEKQFHDAQRANEGKLTADIIDGKPISADAIAEATRRQLITPEAARTALNLMRKPDDVPDDPKAVIDLENRLYRDGQDINREIVSGAGTTISKATASRLLKENEDRKKAPPMDAQQKMDFDFMGKYLGSDKLAFSFDEDTAQRLALAQREFNRRVVIGKENSGDVANELVARFARKVEPVPGSILGDIKTREEVGPAAQRLQQLRQNNLITDEQLAKEAQRLRQIEETLPPPAPPKKGAKKGGGAVVQ